MAFSASLKKCKILEPLAKVMVKSGINDIGSVPPPRGGRVRVGVAKIICIIQ